MKPRLQNPFQNLFLKYNKMVWVDILFLLVLTFCIWLGTNLQRINHFTNPMDLARAWSVLKGNWGGGGGWPEAYSLGSVHAGRGNELQSRQFSASVVLLSLPVFFYSQKHTDKTKDTELMTHAFCQLTLSSSGQFTLIFLFTLNM